MSAETIIYNAKIATNQVPSFVEAVAILDGKISAAGENEDILRLREAGMTQVIDANGRTVIPGLNDSHIHPIRGGLNYNMELRWDGVPSLADALRMLKEQAARTPAPQWVRVIGGWTEFQFAERRMPTLDEINEAAPDTPVFVLHLYDRALLNRAALRAVGYDKSAPDFPAGSGSDCAVPNTAARTRAIVPCAVFRARADPSARISCTRAGWDSNSRRRARTGAIH